MLYCSQSSGTTIESSCVPKSFLFYFYSLTNVGRYKQKKERFRESLIQFMFKKFATVPHAAANKSN